MNPSERTPLLERMKSEYPTVSQQLLRKWPNLQTLFTVATAVNSMAYGVIKAPVLWRANLLLRSLSILARTCPPRNHLKIASDLVAIVALLTFEKGWAAALVVDLLSEGWNFYQTRSFPRRELPASTALTLKTGESGQMLLPTRIEPTDKPSACRILNVPQDREKDVEFIRTRHASVRAKLISRREQAVPSFAAPIDQLIQDVDKAYTTLIGSPPS